jgi:hypothetical protein
MAERYGIAYQGSKARIAQQILALMPRATHFYDLFAGGCAMTHAALLSGKYDIIHYNDIGDAPKLFEDAINGKYRNECRWISREQFFAEKDSDHYVRFLWSFGNDGRTYMYGRDVEPLKKAMHYAICFNDDSLLKELGIDIGEVVNEPMSAVKHAKICAMLHSKQVESLARLTQLQRLQNLEHLRRLQRLQKDYREVEIYSDAVIYADPPYRQTKSYATTANGFDHEAFDEWVRSRNQPVYVSEYTMPSDFIEILAVKCATLQNSATPIDRVEKVFVHERWINDIPRTTLF